MKWLSKKKKKIQVVILTDKPVSTKSSVNTTSMCADTGDSIHKRDPVHQKESEVTQGDFVAKFLATS